MIVFSSETATVKWENRSSSDVVSSCFAKNPVKFWIASFDNPGIVNIFLHHAVKIL